MYKLEKSREQSRLQGQGEKNFQNPLVARDEYDHNQSSIYCFYSSLVRLSFGEIVSFFHLYKILFPKD